MRLSWGSIRKPAIKTQKQKEARTWLFTKQGFFSAVFAREGSGKHDQPTITAVSWRYTDAPQSRQCPASCSPSSERASMPIQSMPCLRRWVRSEGFFCGGC